MSDISQKFVVVCVKFRTSPAFCYGTIQHTEPPLPRPNAPNRELHPVSQ